MNRTLTLIALAVLLPARPVRAQEPAPPLARAGTPEPDFLDAGGPKAQLLLLGSFHFDYPDLDVQKSQHRLDVLAPDRQHEIEALVERLAAYRPTRVAVEARRSRQARLDSLYREYAAGRWELEHGETYQIGFRLAKRLGHDRVYAVDEERHRFFVDLARDELAPRERELLATDREWRDRFRRLHEYEDSVNAAQRRSIGDLFVAMNSPGRIHRSHLPYAVGFFKFDGDEDGYMGADFISGWYNRNLRIFRNLQRITGSAHERILLVIGSGHLPVLRFITAHSPEYRLVEANHYLEATPDVVR